MNPWNIQIHKFAGLFFIAWFTVAALPCQADESDWIYGNGEAVADFGKTLSEVEKEALAKARRSVVENSVGVKVSSETIVKNFMTQSDFVAYLSTGFIVKERILKWEAKILNRDQKTPPLVLYKVHIEAKVAFEKGKSDPSFKIYASLNRTVFKHGDNITLRIRPSADCYITIFVITEDDQAFLLFPNKYQKNNHINHSTDFIYPSQWDLSKGMTLKASLLEGTRKTTERFKIIATKRPVKFTPVAFVQATALESYSQASAPLTQLFKELMMIQASDRTEATLSYSIVR